MPIRPKKTYGRRKQRTAFKDVKPGDLVATYLNEYSNEWPQIGQVTKVLRGSKVELLWFTGTLSSKWKKLRVRVKERRLRRGVREEWKEEVDRRNIILPPFKLTAGGKLPRSTMRALKDMKDDYF